MIKLKSIDYKIISELTKNSRLSDRQVAKKLGTSQPTVTRRRTELEKEGLLAYTSVPDLKKLGFEILAFTFGKLNFDRYTQKSEELGKFLQKHSGIIFTSTGTGLGWDEICISVHKDYSDYRKVMQDLKTEIGESYELLSSFIVSLQSDNIQRNLTFKYLVRLLEEDYNPL